LRHFENSKPSTPSATDDPRMQILTYDDLTPSMERDRTLIHLSSFGGVSPAREIDLWRRRAHAFADYVGLFAVEGGEVLGQLFVLRIPYVFSDGPGEISGIAGVGTRPDRGRQGIARMLFTEALQRERKAGFRYSLLWTNRSWVAHGFYEFLGYRDVYSSPWAVHAPSARRRRSVRSAAIRPARNADLSEIDLLHDRFGAQRLGFCRRVKGYFPSAFLSGWIDPAQNLLVARSDRGLVGYAHLDRTPRRIVCGELVGYSLAVRRKLVAEVARRSVGMPFAFQHSVVTDSPALFQNSGYSTVAQTWNVLMAAAIGREWSTSEAVDQFGTKDTRFLCFSADRF
jgi:GNAT superfamily N-acetyltransferase